MYPVSKALLNDDRFKNEVTHLVKISEPSECCGGILADEMGMGKSLSLIALIIYTLHSRRSKNHESEHLAHEKDDIWSSATLIITPKSSTSLVTPL